MKTSTVEVRDLLSPLSARGVEKRLSRVPGIKRVEVNMASALATIEYDESLIDLKTIKDTIAECGYHCSGELLPKHICEPQDPPGDVAANIAHLAGGHDLARQAAHAPTEAHSAVATHAH